MKNLKKITIFIILYLVIFGFYLLVTPDISEHAFGLHMRRFIPATLAALLPYLIFKNFTINNFKLEFLLSLFWSLLSPILYSPSSLPYDVATGPYLFCFLSLFKILTNKYCNKLLSIYYIALLFLFLVPTLNTLYFLIFSKPINHNGMMVVFQTNPQEAIEYLYSLNVKYILLFTLLLIIFITICTKDFKQTVLLDNYDLSYKRCLLTILIATITGYYTFFSLMPRTQFIKIAIDTQNYFKSVEKYTTLHDSIVNDLKLQSSINNNLPYPNTVIMVIGESATKNYMKAFNENNDETTPWLSANTNDFILFKNAYSCAWNTVPALEHALTEANYYNNKEFNQSISIIDIAKKAGYKTYWFSNQGKIGAYDTPITMVAKTCDVSLWTESTQYDESLLSYLKTVNKNENNFVVLHIMGSHIDYNNRYPTSYQKWTDPNVTGRVADYKNSLLYTDKVLQDFFNYANSNLNLSAFIYFSDHGTDPNRSRDPDETKFIGLRIPLFVYLSDDYKQSNPYTAKTLKYNQNVFFSNDLIYNLVCGILNIKSNHFNEEESLSSIKYKFNIDNTKAGLGQKFVKDDPYL